MKSTGFLGIAISVLAYLLVPSSLARGRPEQTLPPTQGEVDQQKLRMFQRTVNVLQAEQFKSQVLRDRQGVKVVGRIPAVSVSQHVMPQIQKPQSLPMIRLPHKVAEPTLSDLIAWANLRLGSAVFPPIGHWFWTPVPEWFIKWFFMMFWSIEEHLRQKNLDLENTLKGQ